MAGPLISAISRRFPRLGRVADALFGKGGDIVLPSQPARAEQTGPQSGVTTPALPQQPPVTVTVPNGILRDPANITALITLLYWVARMFGWEPPFSQDEAVSLVNQVAASDGIVTTIGLILTAVFRTKSKNITRG